MKKEIIYIGEIEVIRSSLYWNYGASYDGRVFRIDTKKEMSVSLRGREGDSYLCFRSCHNNVPKNTRVNIIVADCWCVNDDPSLKTEVNHIDGNKLNNNASNLEWVTRSQNQRHAIDTGLKGKGEELYNASMSNDVAHQVCQHLQDGWRVKDVADKFCVPADNIRKIKAGDTYFTIRALYKIKHEYKTELSEKTVRWLCECINKGMSDKQIADSSSNKAVSRIECKRIRYKIRYKLISDEYF